MGEYGSEITMQRAFAYNKERIKHALKGELMCDEDENGFIYAPASKEECEKYILDAYDDAVYWAIALARDGRVLEKLLQENGYKFDFKHYRDLSMKEQRKDYESGEYIFEDDLEDESGDQTQPS